MDQLNLILILNQTSASSDNITAEKFIQKISTGCPKKTVISVKMPITGLGRGLKIKEG